MAFTPPTTAALGTAGYTLGTVYGNRTVYVKTFTTLQVGFDVTNGTGGGCICFILPLGDVAAADYTSAITSINSLVPGFLNPVGVGQAIANWPANVPLTGAGGMSYLGFQVT